MNTRTSCKWIPPQLEDDVDRIGDMRHVPEIVKVPGVTRHALEKSAVTGVREYTAIYRANSPDVPRSADSRARYGPLENEDPAAHEPPNSLRVPRAAVKLEEEN